MTEQQLIHVLLVSGRDQVSDWLITTLRTEAGVVLVGTAPSLERAAGLIGQRHLDVILLDTSAPDAKHLERLQAITAAPLSPATILMVDPGEVAFVQQALFAGARAFLLKPFTQAQLVESLRQTFSILMQQRQALSASASVGVVRDESAEILVSFSPKGGVGRTSLAASLAVALHQESRKPVTLVDGDLQFGDVDIAVNVMARKSIADLLGYVNELEPALVESVLIDHPSGMRLLLAPPYFDPALQVDEGRLAHLVKMVAAAQRGYVVVDAPAGLGESTLSLLDVARRVLLVTATSVASLRAAKRFLELAAKMDYADDKIVLVLSGYRKESDVPLEEVERHLGRPVAVAVPSDPIAMALALNQGQPIISRDRNHPVSKAIIKLARYLGAGSGAGEALKSETGQALSSPDGRIGAVAMVRVPKPRQAFGT